MKEKEQEIREILWEAEVFLMYRSPRDGLLVR